MERSGTLRGTRSSSSRYSMRREEFDEEGGIRCKRYIIVLKLSVKEIKREALIVKKYSDYIPKSFPV